MACHGGEAKLYREGYLRFGFPLIVATQGTAVIALVRINLVGCRPYLFYVTLPVFQRRKLYAVRISTPGSLRPWWLARSIHLSGAGVAEAMDNAGQ